MDRVLDPLRVALGPLAVDTPVAVHAGETVVSVPAGPLLTAIGPPAPAWHWPLVDTAYLPRGWVRALLWPGARYALGIHTGDDLIPPDAATGRQQPIRAIRDGEVVAAFFWQRTGGNTLVIRHVDEDGSPFCVRYAHTAPLSPPLAVGARVRAGEVVARVSDSGMPGAVHLHMDVARGDVLARTPGLWPSSTLAEAAARRLTLEHFISPFWLLDRRIGGRTVPPSQGEWYECRLDVNVRVSATRSAYAIGMLLPGQRVRIAETVEADGHVWGRITDGESDATRDYAGAWAALREARAGATGWLTRVPVAAPTGTANGIHVAGSGHIGALEQVARALKAAGTPMPGVLVVNDAPLAERLADSAEVVVFRPNVGGDDDPLPYGGDGPEWQGWADPAAWVARHLPAIRQAPRAHFYQLSNEPGFAHNVQSLEYADRAAAFEIGLMREAERAGIRLAVGAWYTGTPDPKYYPRLRPVLEHAAAHGHAVNFHWYWATLDAQGGVVADDSPRDGFAYMAGRFLDFAAEFPGLVVIVGEAAAYRAPRFRGVERMLLSWREVDELLRPYRQRGMKVVAMHWTVRGQLDPRWRGDDFTDHLDAYAAYVRSYAPPAPEPVPEPPPPPPATRVQRGANIDPANGVAPSADELHGFDLVRFAYNVSRGTGSVDLGAARALFEPVIARYRAAGITSMLVLTHQLWGEGQGFYWPRMGTYDWTRLIAGFVDYCGHVAATYRESVMYQVWNEGDSASEAAVGIPAEWYGRLLDEAVIAIRGKAPGAQIVSQGHVLNRPSYWLTVRQHSRFAETLAGVCIHAYGHGPAGPFAPFGTLEPVLARWKQVTKAPIWITEWGMLNMTPTPQQAADYARGFLAQANAGGAAGAVWFAWGRQHANVPVAGNPALRAALIAA